MKATTKRIDGVIFTRDPATGNWGIAGSDLVVAKDVIAREIGKYRDGRANCWGVRDTDNAWVGGVHRYFIEAARALIDKFDEQQYKENNINEGESR